MGLGLRPCCLGCVLRWEAFGRKSCDRFAGRACRQVLVEEYGDDILRVSYFVLLVYALLLSVYLSLI